MEGKERILVLGINCMPELTGIGKYTGEMVSWLAENGHNTTVVTGFPYYPYWEVQEPYSGRFFKKETSHRGNLSIYRCPMYVPAEPSGLKRLIHEFSFFLSSFLVIVNLMFGKRYDYIFSVAPPFHLGFLALFYRFFRGGKIVYHIQDLQVDAAKELGMLPNGLFPVLFSMEKFILSNVDFVSTISEGMMNRIKSKFNGDVLFFPNWVDTDRFYPIDDKSSLKEKWGFNSDDKIVLYSGSLGEKQGLDVLIDIADNLKEHANIKFLICGTGPFKESLVKSAEDKCLVNVRFLPLQGNDVFNDFLNMADVHLVLQKGDASDLVMPSKLTTILSVGGLALVTANEKTTLHKVIMENNMGVVVPAENQVELQRHILLSCTQENNDFRYNARRYAERYLNMESILGNLLFKMNKSSS